MDQSYYEKEYDNTGKYLRQRQHEMMDDREYYQESNRSSPHYHSEGEASGESRRASSFEDEEYYSQSNPSRRSVPREDEEYYSQSNPSRRSVPREDSEYYSQSDPSRRSLHSVYYSQSNPSHRSVAREESDYYSQSNPSRRSVPISDDYYTEGGSLGESRLDSSRIDRSRMQDDNVDFNYDDDNDPHLPPIEERVVDRTEAGEFHGDSHDVKISITPRVYIYAICAAINSCNLGYDIGISSGAAKKVQNSLDLSGVQVQLFLQSVN